MKLFKIRNKYLFRNNNPNGVHIYALYYDKTDKRYKAVATTHLYVKDDKRFKQVKKGKISVFKFKEFDVPSGVQNYYYSKNVNGGNIDIKDSENIVPFGNRYLTKKQSNFIKDFAKYDYNKRNPVSNYIPYGKRNNIFFR